ncbi:hypothetical protein CLOSYM_01784 [[Clostridium] symbiosum ATCC 14940]|uniref:Uncharacterized protein n=1 Tax=[Clostridium] symbiosum ATCC 14940 TaxID=411472 RepID=A0ABC9TZB7_CLOSY|nr:hypothetical protein CLOSYM_01784 [[Clostridium] symbiosum ATCC 14940]
MTDRPTDTAGPYKKAFSPLPRPDASFSLMTVTCAQSAGYR